MCIHIYLDLLVRCLAKGSENMFPNGGLMVIYYVTIRKKSPKKQIQVLHMCQGLNSHYFHIIGDGHQPNSRGLCTHYKDSY